MDSFRSILNRFDFTISSWMGLISWHLLSLNLANLRNLKSQGDFVINYEAVKGLEWNKYSNKTTPEYLAHIPFIRMLAGPMDYTSGGMYNVSESDFRISMQLPMTQGTLCRQLALFTLLYAPLDMLADSPTTYEKEPRILEYISGVSTIWDETIAITGEVGGAVVARRKGSTWYISGITDYKQRTLSIIFDFLDADKSYKGQLFTNGKNADRIGEDYNYNEVTLLKNQSLGMMMTTGGGFTLKLKIDK